MAADQRFEVRQETAWCPGCGNFGIVRAVAKALNGLGLDPSQVLFVSGIGQAGKLPHYVSGNVLNTLHGRTLPTATGAKLANGDLTVIAVGGDGDGYAEGGNHFLHAIRKNVNITYIVHDNQVFGLTKGQASPRSDPGMVTGTTPLGVYKRSTPGDGRRPSMLVLSLGAMLATRSIWRGSSKRRSSMKALPWWMCCSRV